MRHKGCASLGLWAFALLGGAAAARAAPLQLQGELTITNRTDELDPSSALFNLPGGREFTLSVLVDPGGFDPLELLGETTLAPAFWPDPGLTFTGTVVVDFVSPGSGVIEVEPIRIDGLMLVVGLSDMGGEPIAGGLFPERFDDPALFDLRKTSVGRPPLVGTAAIRLDAIVPEPSTGMALAVWLGGLAATKRRARDAVRGPRTADRRSRS